MNGVIPTIRRNLVVHFTIASAAEMILGSPRSARNDTHSLARRCSSLEVELTESEPSLPIEAEAIQRILPHRYPFLLVDRVIELAPPHRAVGIKQVTVNEPFFQGHFPGYPVMPGVLIVEAMAQVGGVAVLSAEEYRGKLALFAGIDNVRFKRQVKPGDTLRLEVELHQIRRGIGMGSGTATVDGDLACRGEIMFALVDKPEALGGER